MPALSILIPTYNPNLPWLEKALLSIKAQSFGGYEVMLVNDGSNKVSPEEIRAVVDKVAIPSLRFLSLGRNMGFNRAVNHALEQATGQYSLILGDDDFLISRDFLERALALLDSDPDATLLMADYLLRREELDHETTITMFPERESWIRPGLELFWKRFWLPAVPAIGWVSLIFRIADARAAGGFLEPVGDMRLFITLLQRGKLAYLPMVGGCYRFRQGNTSSRGNFDVLRASVTNVGRLAGEAFDQACALQEMPEPEKSQRRLEMLEQCRIHAAKNLRYFRSLGRITFKQSFQLYPLVFSSSSFKGLLNSAGCLLCLLLPPVMLRGLKTVVVRARGN